jgi:SARP family transcriptional regulator, regulator of embCAB operon
MSESKLNRFRKKTGNDAERLYVKSFGGLTLYYHDSPITIVWESQKARIMFCYLLVTCDQWIHRDKLIEILWPGCDPQSGINNFKTTLSRLRKSFAGPQVINPVIIQGEALRINHELIETDIEKFRASALNGIKLHARGDFAHARPCLEAAQDLYYGDFLPDEPFNAYITAARLELAQIYSHVLRILARVYQQEGNHDGVEALLLLQRCSILAPV